MKKGLFILCIGFLFCLSACQLGEAPGGIFDPENPAVSPEDVDLSGVVFEDTEFEYSGSEYELTAFFVPEGVTVEYLNNTRTELGSQEVTAIFKVGNKEIGRQTVTLSIVPVQQTLYFLSGVNEWTNNDEYKLEAVNGVYQITLDLKEGDQFKISDSNTWAVQYHIGGLFGDYSVFTAGHDDDGVANDNVYVKEAGTYTFYLDPTNNTLDVEKDGVKLEKVAGSIYYVKGSMNGWAASPAYRLAYDEGSNSVSVVVTLKVEDQFKLSAVEWVDAVTMSYTHIAAKEYPQFVLGTDNDNIKCIAAGTYRITVLNYDDPYNAEKFALQELVIEVLEGGNAEDYVPPVNEYYLRGTFNNWTDQEAELADFAFNVDGEIATLTYTIEEGAMFKIATNPWGSEFNYSKLTYANEALKANFTEGTDDNGANNGNIKVLVAGTYTFTINGYGTSNETIVVSLAQ